jgi:hypothetical protein
METFVRSSRDERGPLSRLQNGALTVVPIGGNKLGYVMQSARKEKP